MEGDGDATRKKQLASLGEAYFFKCSIYHIQFLNRGRAVDMKKVTFPWKWFNNVNFSQQHASVYLKGPYDVFLRGA